MKTFDVTVGYSQRIFSTRLFTVQAETEAKACKIIEDMIEDDAFLEEGLEQAGFEEVSYDANGPDIYKVRERSPVDDLATPEVE
jgi:uncharacterized protein YjiK